MANAYHTKEKYKQIGLKLRGQKRSKETKEKISKALKGHKHSLETLAKLRKPRSEEGRRNISKAMMGKTPWNKGKTGIYSQETIDKIRKANLGKIPSEQTRLKQRQSMIKHFKSLNPDYQPPKNLEGIHDRKHEKVRRDRIRKNGGTHTKAQWESLKDAYNYRCPMCSRIEPEISLTKDHIISLRNGGSDDIANIQPLCRSCNSKKR